LLTRDTKDSYSSNRSPEYKHFRGQFRSKSPPEDSERKIPRIADTKILDDDRYRRNENISARNESFQEIQTSAITRYDRKNAPVEKLPPSRFSGKLK